VENFPGYTDGVQGPKMMEDLRAQAVRFGAEVRPGLVSSVDFSGDVKKVTLSGGEEITADSVIVCTGAAARYLGLPDERKYMGLGVSACATCDGFFYRGRTVAVVGPHGGCGRRWRHSLRGGIVPFKSCQKGVPYRA